jgi:hypothetical protein
MASTPRNPSFPLKDITAPDADGNARDLYVFRSSATILRLAAVADKPGASLKLTVYLMSEASDVVGCIRLGFKTQSGEADFSGHYVASPEDPIADAWFPIGAAVGCKAKVDAVSDGSTWQIDAMA